MESLRRLTSSLVDHSRLNLSASTSTSSSSLSTSANISTASSASSHSSSFSVSSSSSSSSSSASMVSSLKQKFLEGYSTAAQNAALAHAAFSPTGSSRDSQPNWQSLDVTAIADRLLVVGFPVNGPTKKKHNQNNVDELAAFLQAKHRDHFLIFNLNNLLVEDQGPPTSASHATSAADKVHSTNPLSPSYSANGHANGNGSKHGKTAPPYKSIPERLQQQMLDFNWERDGMKAHTPSLDFMFRICYAIFAWLALDAKNVALVNCQTGKTRSGVVLACYLLFARLADDSMQAFLEFYLKRWDMKNLSIRALKDRTPPSIQRFLSYFHSLVENQKAPNEKPLLLKAMICRTLPVDTKPCIQIWDDYKMVFSSSEAALSQGALTCSSASSIKQFGRSQQQNQQEVPEIEWNAEDGFLAILWERGVELDGGFSFLCSFGDVYDAMDENSLDVSSKILFRYADSTWFISPGLLTLTKKHLDMMKQYEFGFDDENFSIDLVFGESTKPRKNYVPIDYTGNAAVKQGIIEIAKHHLVLPDPEAHSNLNRLGFHDIATTFALQRSLNHQEDALLLLRSEGLQACFGSPREYTRPSAGKDSPSRRHSTAEVVALQSQRGRQFGSFHESAGVCGVCKDDDFIKRAQLVKCNGSCRKSYHTMCAGLKKIPFGLATMSDRTNHAAYVKKYFSAWECDNCSPKSPTRQSIESPPTSSPTTRSTAVSADSPTTVTTVISSCSDLPPTSVPISAADVHPPNLLPVEIPAQCSSPEPNASSQGIPSGSAPAATASTSSKSDSKRDSIERLREFLATNGVSVDDLLRAAMSPNIAIAPRGQFASSTTQIQSNAGSCLTHTNTGSDSERPGVDLSSTVTHDMATGTRRSPQTSPKSLHGSAATSFTLDKSIGPSTQDRLMGSKKSPPRSPRGASSTPGDSQKQCILNTQSVTIGPSPGSASTQQDAAESQASVDSVPKPTTTLAQGEPLVPGDTAKYLSMAQRGVPMEAVRHCMKKDGLDTANIDLPVVRSISEAPPESAPDNRLKLRDVEEYRGYFRMQELGCAKEAIKQKMVMDGQDPAVMDFGAKAVYEDVQHLISVNKQAASRDGTPTGFVQGIQNAKRASSGKQAEDGLRSNLSSGASSSCVVNRSNEQLACPDVDNLGPAGSVQAEIPTESSNSVSSSVPSRLSLLDDIKNARRKKQGNCAQHGSDKDQVSVSRSSLLDDIKNAKLGKQDSTSDEQLVSDKDLSPSCPPPAPSRFSLLDDIKNARHKSQDSLIKEQIGSHKQPSLPSLPSVPSRSSLFDEIKNVRRRDCREIADQQQTGSHDVSSLGSPPPGWSDFSLVGGIKHADIGQIESLHQAPSHSESSLLTKANNAQDDAKQNKAAALSLESPSSLPPRSSTICNSSTVIDEHQQRQHEPISEPCSTKAVAPNGSPQEQHATSVDPSKPNDESKDVPLKHHEQYAMYFKMLSMGIPEGAVRHKMMKDKVDVRALELGPDASFSKLCEMIHASAVTLKDHPAYAKYFKMLTMGIPEGAVQHKMIKDGVNTKALELGPDAPYSRLMQCIDNNASEVDLSKKTKKTSARRRKKLHWQPISEDRLSSINQQTIWEEKDDESLDLEMDMDEFESLFFASNDATTSKRKNSGPRLRRKQNITLIDGKRAMNAAISLARIKLTYAEIAQAIASFDSQRLTLDQLRSLSDFLPTPEEVDVVRGFTGDRQLLGEAEKFFLEVSFVPRVGPRTQCLVYQLSLPSHVGELTSSLSNITRACEEVRSSRLLRILLSIVLKLGNTLNSESNEIRGFTVDSLLRLSQTKAFNQRTTVLHYLVSLLKKNHPQVLEFADELKSVPMASRESFETVESDLRKLQQGLELLQQEKQQLATDHQQQPGTNLEQIDAGLAKSIEQFEQQLSSLQQIITDTKAQVAGVLEYFGEDPQKNATEFFLALASFCATFQVARKEVDAADQAKERQERMKLRRTMSMAPATARPELSSFPASSSSNDLLGSINRPERAKTDHPPPRSYEKPKHMASSCF